MKQLDTEAAVTSLIDGLSFMGGTMEAIQAPVEDPQEWKPEVGGGGACTAQLLLHVAGACDCPQLHVVDLISAGYVE